MLDEAGFWLWWLGYDVKPGWGKRTLLKHLGPPEPTPANGGDLDPLDVVEQQADELLSGTPASGLVRDLSHRLHHQQDDVRAVLEALLLAALGDRPEWTTRAMREELDEPSLQTLVMKGLGWPADLTAGWRQAFPHLDGTEEAVPLIFDFMTALRIWDLSGMRTFAADLPDSDFARMRDVLRMVSERARQEVTVGLFSFEDHGVYAIRASVLFLLLFIFSAYTVAWSCSMAEGRGKPEQARNQDILRRMRMCIRCVSMKLRSPEVWSSPEPSFRA